MQENEARFTPELLKQTGDFVKYSQLEVLEPGINWLGYCAKLYKKSHKISSVAKHVNGAWCFSEYLAENAEALKLDLTKPLISQVFEQMTAATNSAKYKVLDEFSTYCDGIKGYRPNTTWSYVQNVKSLAKYCDTGITNDGFKDHVSMPAMTQLDEEYPPNDVILRILDACPPDLRRFLLYIIDTGAEPADAAKLNKDMISFDETPVRIQFKRKKTGKPITQFANSHTANALREQIKLTDSPQGFVFFKEPKQRSYSTFYDNYNEALKRVGMAEKIEGSNIGKYHFKIFKKRWFTMAITAGVPEFVAQGMLGRKKYLDQYMALPLEEKRDFAKKILRKVSIYSSEQDQAERRKNLSDMLGLEVTPDLEAKLKAALFRLLDEPKSPILQGD